MKHGHSDFRQSFRDEIVINCSVFALTRDAHAHFAGIYYRPGNAGKLFLRYYR